MIFFQQNQSATVDPLFAKILKLKKNMVLGIVWNKCMHYFWEKGIDGSTLIFFQQNQSATVDPLFSKILQK